MICLYMHHNAFLPNITQREVEAFKSEPIRLKYFGNTSNGKNVLYFKTGVGLFENLFNPNLYTDERMEEFMTGDGVTLFTVLVDSVDMTVKAIRHMTLSKRITDKLKDIWQSTMNSKITREEYNDWVDNEITPINPALHFSMGWDIGVIRGGLVNEQAVFFGE